jgi:hypothetical protein
MPVGIRQNKTVEVRRKNSKVEGRMIKTAKSQHDYYFG